jgi:hypothetical protein
MDNISFCVNGSIHRVEDGRRREIFALEQHYDKGLLVGDRVVGTRNTLASGHRMNSKFEFERPENKSWDFRRLCEDSIYAADEIQVELGARTAYSFRVLVSGAE